MEAKAIENMWNEGINRGNGYQVCYCNPDCSCDINELHHLGELVVATDASDDAVALYRKECGSLVAVANALGPWAVDVEQPTMAREWIARRAEDRGVGAQHTPEHTPAEEVEQC